jgi:RNA polymerase sigma factor (sigma-70 family)
MDGNELVKKYSVLVDNLARKMTPNNGLARLLDEDQLRQIGRLAVIEAKKNYEKEKGAFATHAHKIIKRRMLDAIRAARWRTEPIIPHFDMSIIIDERIGDPDVSIDINSAISVLDIGERKIVEMYFYKGLTHKEIAATLGCCERTIERRKVEILKKMKDYLSPLS